MKILIAEDERDLADALEAILTHSGFLTEAVYNGEDALDYLLQGRYDLAVMDVMMPGPSGLEVLSNLRAQGADVPVLLLTARSRVEDKVEGLRLGADDYLTKPFEVSELLARVEALLRRPRSTYGEAMTFEDLSLNRADFSLHCGEQQLSLTNKEFQLLEFFMRHRGQILSKEQMMDNIWGEETEAKINVVWVNISGLRKKLKDLGSRVTIKAQRGLGYRLELGG
ncbi:Phosphate regulon transcriptional regulatory protein PhoB (SphR) [Clostridiaceae bacterium JG1575]|nr:Phosphate regulon transcriptional regulatory protein PhoB (SphR) [Clostridiaceae bacterium JG1575]